VGRRPGSVNIVLSKSRVSDGRGSCGYRIRTPALDEMLPVVQVASAVSQIADSGPGDSHELQFAGISHRCFDDETGKGV